MIRDRIRRWLGITEIQEDQAQLLNYFKSMDWNVNSKLANVDRRLGAVLPGLGRVIVKLDPTFGQDDMDPAKKAESDRLGQAALNRLWADDKARKHTLGEL